MANADHLKMLQQSVDAWNAWRKQNPVGSDFIRAKLSGADLRRGVVGADLYRPDLSEAYLSGVYLGEADLSGADLSLANLSGANLSGANLRDADLSEANLRWARLIGANLSGADLRAASLVDADITNADLTGCHIYGVSAWKVKLSSATRQQDLVITEYNEPKLTVDNIEVAQFVYLLLHNAKVRDVIDTITSKAVLILGRFTAERKTVLDALRDQLRKRDYLPILFDFDKPASKDLTGTVQTLANMVRFIVADGTDPKSIPHELATIVPTTIVPVKPILLASEREYAMFGDLQRRYPWVLPTHRYEHQEQLIADLDLCIIRPAAEKAEELRKIVST
jgi:hypothetical protein